MADAMLGMLLDKYFNGGSYAILKDGDDQTCDVDVTINTQGQYVISIYHGEDGYYLYRWREPDFDSACNRLDKIFSLFS